MEGVVNEVMPDTRFRVGLENGHNIIAYMAGKMRKHRIPSLAALYGLALDCAERKVLGPDVDIVITATDETNTRVVPAQIIDRLRAAEGRALVALVGVQSNQFPRAMDIARPIRAAGIPVCI